VWKKRFFLGALEFEVKEKFREMQKVHDDILIENLSFSYKYKKREIIIFENLNLFLKRKKITVVMGKSGVGKSTLLRLIAGLEKPALGSIRFSDPSNAIEQIRMSYLFQDLRVLPWKTALANVEIALESVPSRLERTELAKTALISVGLGDRLKAYPSELSGGMLQRLALARALALSPSLVLLDEPFSGLDVQTLVDVERMFLRLHNKEPFTTLMVTHVPEQSVMMGDEIVVFGGSPAKQLLTIGLEEMPPPLGRDKRAGYFQECVRKVEDMIYER